VTDQIEVRGLRVLAVCGVLPEERERAQPLGVDLDVELDADAAAVSDDLADTANYAALCDAAVAALHVARPRLLEHACEVVGAAVLDADARVLAVTVSVAKLRPPIPHDVASVAVRRRVHR
jgi:7,8-dihydroneopterin aldolase/epimerase/oxygenase